MKCNEIREKLSLYLDDELNEDEKKLIDEHLESCHECKKEFEEYKKIISILNNLPEEEPPAGYCERLHEKLLNENISELKDDHKRENKKKGYNWIKYASLAAALALIIVVSGINNLGGRLKSSENSAYDMAQVAHEFAAPAEMADGRGGEADYNFDQYKLGVLEEKGYGKDEINNMSLETKELKIIKTGIVYVQTENYDNFFNDLNIKIDSIGGFIENNTTEVRKTNDNEKLMYGNLRLRIPQDSFYELINYLEENAEVIRKNINEDDVTKQYYEIDNKVKNLEIQEQHLRDLFEKAQTVEEMIQIENELRRIRTEIDSLNMNLTDINDRASMSTINLEVEEVKKVNLTLKSEDNIWERAKEGFIKTVNSIVKGFGDLIVNLVSILPILVPVLVVLVILYKKIRKYLKK